MKRPLAHLVLCLIFCMSLLAGPALSGAAQAPATVGTSQNTDQNSGKNAGKNAGKNSSQNTDQATPSPTKNPAPQNPAQSAAAPVADDDDDADTAPQAAPAKAEEAKTEEAIQEEARLRAQREAAAATDKLRQEAEAAQAAIQDTVKRDRSWEDALLQQQAEINRLEVEADNLSKQLGGVIRPLRTSMPEMEETIRRLMSLSVTHKADPLMLEMLDRRAMMLAAGLRLQLQPINAAKTLVTELGESVNQIKYTMPDIGFAPTDEGPSQQDARADAKEGEDPVITPVESAAWEQLHRVEFRINRLTYRLDRAIAPAETLLASLDTFDTRLKQELPPIWQQYYLTVPNRFFDPAGWQNLTDRFARMRQNLALRLGVEMPQGKAAWQGFALRLINMMILGAVVIFFVNRWMRRLSSEKMGNDPGGVCRNITIGLGWMCAGMACMAASFGSRGEVYRLMMVCASLLIMWGKMTLAWNTRCIIIDKKPGPSPLWSLYACSAFGVVLSYPSLPSGIYSLAWLATGLTGLWLTRPGTITSRLPGMESKLVTIHRLALWASLGLAAFGWARMGILLLVTVDCLLINSQLIIGIMQHINRTAEVHENQQVHRSLTSGLIAACLAPVVLLMVPLGMVLWVMALPGGAPLLWHYLGTAVSIGSATFNALHILLIVSAFYITRSAIAACQKLLLRLSATSTRLDQSLIPPMQTGITYGLWTLFALFTIRALGFGLDNLAVVAGGLSVGIGFGLQTIVNNFLSGLILIFSRTLHEGDIIDVGTVQGVVRKISVRATTVETFDNAVIFVPNSEFVANRLVNWTRNGRSVRRDLSVGVAYGTDPALVETLLLDIAQQNQLVLRRPQPLVLFVDFADSSLNFTLRYWADISNALDAASAMRKQIAATFTEHGINIAFPQLDIHIINTPHGVAR